MKIAFINNANESLGVEYLSAYLKKNGHSVRLFVDPQLFCDENIRVPFLHRRFSSKENLVAQVIAYAPDLIGFSVVSDFYPWACDLAKEIKKKSSIPIIFGGIHPTCVPEQVIANDAVDFVCVGEGEEALLELVERLRSGDWPVDVQNIWAKQGGRVMENSLRPLLSDLNRLPDPDKQLFRESGAHYQIGYFTMASRGCLFQCSYCHHSYLRQIYPGSKYYRYRSVENLLGELTRNFSRKRHRVIRFSDDIFPFDREWLEEFSQKFPARIKAPFICYIHPQTANEETIALLKKSGCCEVQLGVQTLYATTQKEQLNRSVERKKWVELIGLLRAHNIAITAENIIGIPRQSEEEIEDLVRFYCQNRVSRIHVFWLRYYPKTQISRQAAAADTALDMLAKPFTRGGDVFTKRLGKLRAMFALIGIIPCAAVEFLIEKKLYTYIPVWPVSFMNAVSNFQSKTRSDQITRKREIWRYFSFLGKKLCGRN